MSDMKVKRIPKNPVLIVEDSEEFQMLVQGFLDQMGLESRIAQNGKEALEIIKEEEFSIFIVDLMMPVMDGHTFIPLLKKKQPEAIIVVQSGIDSPASIIEIMKLGVFDYIIKPIDPSLFQSTIEKALEFRYLKDLETYQSMNAGKKIRNQLEWLNYKELRRLKDRDYAGIKSVYNLRTTMNQGAGIGAIISMLDLLKGTAQPEGGNYLVQKDIMDFIFDNNEYLRMQVNGLVEVSEILENEMKVERISSSQVLDLVNSIIDRIEPHASSRELKFVRPELDSRVDMQGNLERLDDAIGEMMVNAFKFAKRGSKVLIMTRISRGFFWLSILNEVDEMGIISPENEKLVVEPFFSIMPPNETISDIEKFSLGLGLTVVDNVAKKHRGQFMIHSVKDQTRSDIRNSVMTEFVIPLDEG